jgi:hypothetical protein
MANTGVFDNNFDVTALGALVGIPLRFKREAQGQILDSSSIDLCGVLQGVAVEEKGSMKELHFFFFNQRYTVAQGESYSIEAL